MLQDIATTDLHRLILDQLASAVALSAKGKNKPGEDDPAIKCMLEQCPLLPSAEFPSPLMSQRHQHGVMSLAKLAATTAGASTQQASVDKLLEYVAALHKFSYPVNYRWRIESPENEFVRILFARMFEVADALRAADQVEQAERVIGALWTSLQQMIDLVMSKPAESTAGAGAGAGAGAAMDVASDMHVCTFILPAINGILQAFGATSVQLPSDYIERIASIAKVILGSEFLDRVEERTAAVLAAIGDDDGVEAEQLLDSDGFVTDAASIFLATVLGGGNGEMARRTLRRYNESQSPLGPTLITARFLAVVANALIRGLNIKVKTTDDEGSTAGISTDVLWNALAADPAASADESKTTDSVDAALRELFVLAQQYFVDIHSFISANSGSFASTENSAGNPSRDLFFETEMQALRIATLCIVHLNEMDDGILTSIRSVLSGRLLPHAKSAAVARTSLSIASVIVPRFPEYRTEVIRILLGYIISPHPSVLSSVSSSTAAAQGFDDSMVKHVATALVNTLKPLQDGAKYALQTIQSLFSAISAIEQDTEDDQQQQQQPARSGSGRLSNADSVRNERTFRSSLIVIGTLTRGFPTPFVVTTASSMLTRIMVTPAASPRSEPVETLATVALASPVAGFLEIISSVTTHLHGGSGGRSSNVSASGAPVLVSASTSIAPDPATQRQYNSILWSFRKRIATGLADRDDLRMPYLIHLLGSFVDQMASIQVVINASTATKAELAQRISEEASNYFDVLSELLALPGFEPHLTPTADLVAVFRNAWFLFVLHGFLVDPVLVKKLGAALVSIAAKSPVLVLESELNYLDKHLEYNTVLSRGTSQDSTRTLSAQLAQLLPTISVRELSPAQIVFVLAVYYIESARARTGNCEHIFRYFDNAGVIASPAAVSALEAIALRSVGGFISELQRNSGGSSTSGVFGAKDAAHIRAQVRALLVHMTHHHERVSILARDCTASILRVFPQVLLDRGVLTSIFEIVQLLWQGCKAELDDQFAPVYFFTSEKLNLTIQLPDSLVYRQQLLTRFYEAARGWLLSVARSAPLELDGYLQGYLADFTGYRGGFDAHVGRGLALDIGRCLYTDSDANTITASSAAKSLMNDLMPDLGNSLMLADNSSGFVLKHGARCFYDGQAQALRDVQVSDTALAADIKEKLEAVAKQAAQRASAASASGPAAASSAQAVPELDLSTLPSLFGRARSTIATLKTLDAELIRLLVWIPMHVFTDNVMQMAVSTWAQLIAERPETELVIMVELAVCWAHLALHRRGLFTQRFCPRNVFEAKMQYAPSDKGSRQRAFAIISQEIKPHETLVQFLLNRFDVTRFQSPDVVLTMTRLMQVTITHRALLSTHMLARKGRFQLVLLCFKLLQCPFPSPIAESLFRRGVYNMAFDWFSMAPRWSFSSAKQALKAELLVLIDCHAHIRRDKEVLDSRVRGVISWQPNATASVDSPAASTRTNSILAVPSGSGGEIADAPSTILGEDRQAVTRRTRHYRNLLLLLLESEILRLYTWCAPTKDSGIAISGLPDVTKFKETVASLTDANWHNMIADAWDWSPRLAVFMSERFTHLAIARELTVLVQRFPRDAVDIPEAVGFLLAPPATASTPSANAASHLNLAQLKYLLFWAPVPPISATSYLTSNLGSNPLVLQYAMRSLEHHPVDVVFFYIPQIVQALRHDPLGYIERYILEAAKISQLFAHQIIWNMDANMYRDDDMKIPDSLKPALDRVIATIVAGLSGADREFYRREFKFFGEVTNISGKLKPFIKKSKPEKKRKIDEELRLIKVDPGVYLPSNPEGVVVDIDYDSGRPLQSHAKAPFMATFMVRKDPSSQDVLQNIVEPARQSDAEAAVPTSVAPTSSALSKGTSETRGSLTVRQAAIFKVGDDCRQDVLALQLIAIFKNIFTSVGLDLYLFPYRVVATGAGKGMIDVIPNSISRDQLGREKINDMFHYFTFKFGNPDTIKFQQARTNFVQSVAAYSVILYLLQIKDRHNGNIMLDDQGHVIHIDFGFLLDIAPGGINFESSPFKLTTEMINVMGGGRQAQAYKLFTELCIKAYLAVRPHAEEIVQMVTLMAESGLPCFKGEPTLKKLRARFMLDLTEDQAAQFMSDRIAESYENKRTTLYDKFQALQNGIPY
ncbi:hypothetical protein GQ42DRAFT_163680 [Ramicandelaber brevisporus]|nr:hypothetical protein GQ42DRAFT_163680 [Ramicandelaber brevisporus]